jgi:exopolysaccharide biosynthesis polyprenyl glycosylphosphotransferase
VSQVELNRRRWRPQAGERQLLLILGDLVAASLATFFALWLWAEADYLGLTLVFIRFRAAWFIVLPLVWLLLMINLYDIRRANSWRETLRGALGAAAGGVVLYLIVYFSSAPGSLPRRGILYFLIFVIVLTLIWRWIYVRVFTDPAFMRRVLIVGAGESGRSLLRVVNSMTTPPFIVVGFIDDDPGKRGTQIDGVLVLGGNDRMLEIVREEMISDLIVAILGSMDGQMFQALLDVQEQGVQITRMPVTYEELLQRVPINHLESDWLLRSFVDELRVSAAYLVAKRVIDFIGGLAGVIGLILVYPWVALSLLLESGRPILYAQERLGQGGRSFWVIKFRTMHQDAEADGQAHWAREDDPRITRVGRFLRRTHIDEVPQFLNVLRGDMSVVGPRPERPELIVDLEKQIPFYRARLLTKPGITGWAQVNFGKGASVEGSAEKLEYDLYYIKHRNLTMDLQIIIRTMGSVVGLRGV